MNAHTSRVKHVSSIIWVALLLLLLSSTLASAQGGIAMRDFSVDAGGGVSRGGRFTLTGVIGQPDAATSSGGSFTVQGGLLDPEPWRIWSPIVEK